jgi:hypothetical protein
MNTTIPLTQEKQSVKNVSSRLIWVSPLAMLVASTANIGLYALAGYLFAEVTAWPGASIGQIIGANIVYLLIGAITLAIITRLSRNPARAYLIVATIGLFFSLVLPISAGFGFGPPSTPPASTFTVITLSLMHFVSYAISVFLFVRMALD